MDPNMTTQTDGSNGAHVHGRVPRRWVIIVCAAAIAIGYFLMMSHYQGLHHRDLFQHQDLYAALVYFAEDNCGRLPASPAELVASPYVVQDADGSIRVTVNESSEYYHKTYGVPIRPGWEACVAWGVDVTQTATTQADSSGEATSRLPIRPLFNSPTAVSMAGILSKALTEACEDLRNQCHEEARE